MSVRYQHHMGHAAQMELLQAPAMLGCKLGQAWTLQYALLNGLCRGCYRYHTGLRSRQTTLVKAAQGA